MPITISLPNSPGGVGWAAEIDGFSELLNLAAPPFTWALFVRDVNQELFSFQQGRVTPQGTTSRFTLGYNEDGTPAQLLFGVQIKDGTSTQLSMEVRDVNGDLVDQTTAPLIIPWSTTTFLHRDIAFQLADQTKKILDGAPSDLIQAIFDAVYLKHPHA